MNGHDGCSQTDCVLTLIIGECVVCVNLLMLILVIHCLSKGLFLWFFRNSVWRCDNKYLWRMRLGKRIS